MLLQIPRGPLRRVAALFLPLLAALPLAGCLGFFENDFAPPPVSLTWEGFPDSAMIERALLGNEGAGTRARGFLKKCGEGGPLRVGFIGGSITTGYHSTTPDQGYPGHFLNMLRAACPNADILWTNAAVGASGSRYGVSRFRTDIVDPDLVVVEFAVNDFILPDTQARATYEGLLRQALRNPKTVVLALFTLKGDGQSAQARQAEIAAHYGVQRISYRDAIWPVIQAGTPWDAFFYDDPHPNDSGHAVISRLLYSGLIRAREGPAEKPFPPPLFSDLYETAGILAPGDTSVRVTGSWQSARGAEGRLGFRSSWGVDTMILRTRRRELTLGWAAGPDDVSSVRIVVEGGIDTVINNYFAYKLTLPIVLFSSDTSKPRTVRVIHSPGPSFLMDWVLYAGRE